MQWTKALLSLSLLLLLPFYIIIIIIIIIIAIYGIQATHFINFMGWVIWVSFILLNEFRKEEDKLLPWLCKIKRLLANTGPPLHPWNKAAPQTKLRNNSGNSSMKSSVYVSECNWLIPIISPNFPNLKNVPFKKEVTKGMEF